MPAKLTGPTDIVLSRFQANELDATALHFTLAGTPSLTMAMEAVRVTVPDHDPGADPSYERRAMPNAEFAGDDLTALLADATTRVVKGVDLLEALEEAVFAALQARGTVPSTAAITKDRKGAERGRSQA